MQLTLITSLSLLVVVLTLNAVVHSAQSDFAYYPQFQETLSLNQPLDDSSTEDESDVSFSSAVFVSSTEQSLENISNSNEFDRKVSKPHGAFFAQKIPAKLRQALSLTLNPESIPIFVRECIKKKICSQNDVLHGVAGGGGGKAWSFRARHRRLIMRFWHVYECLAYNRPTVCPIEGRWSKWTSWSACSVACGNGFRERTRQCDDPAPLNYGQFCAGPAKEREECSNVCPKNLTGT